MVQVALALARAVQRFAAEDFGSFAVPAVNERGFGALELMATLPGIEFYKSCGFSETGNFDLELGDGVMLELVPMRKNLWKPSEDS